MGQRLAEGSLPPRCAAPRAAHRARPGAAGWRPAAVGAVGLALALFAAPTAPAPSQAPGQAEATERFVQHHWRYPIPPQGPAPPGYTDLETRLDPAACGACHQAQYRDWSESLHAHSMGPGVTGQLVDMAEEDPAALDACLRCHAPLAEQRPVVESPTGATEANPDFDPALQRAGLVCAGCHLRQHRRYGPPRRGEPERLGKIDGGLPHGGFEAVPAYGRSEFCRSCHQFEPDDYALNGKLLENTYNEWRDSEHAARGIQCQHCHMPERRHLWRGIHDPETTRSAISLNLDGPSAPLTVGATVRATITLTNTGAGHHFPTYLTPRVLINAWLLDAEGQALPDSHRQAVVGRGVSLDLTEEWYDTRIAAGASYSVTYAAPLAERASRLRVELVVEPDYFYRLFYEAMLEGALGARGRPMIEAALRRARASTYRLMEREIPLPLAEGR